MGDFSLKLEVIGVIVFLIFESMPYIKTYNTVALKDA